MKKIIFISLITFLFISCTNENVTGNLFIGTWHNGYDEIVIDRIYQYDRLPDPAESLEEYYKKRKITDSSSFSVSYKHWYGGLVGENRVAGDLKETNARLENGCLVLEKELFYPGGTIEYSSDRIIHGRMIYTKAIK